MLKHCLCSAIAACLIAYVTSLWTGLHKSHAELLKSLFALGLIKREATIELMNKFDRWDFLPHASHESWMNVPICINYSVAMPEQSYHGQTLDAIYKFLKPGGKCLDIGSGTGYIAACMAEMVGPTGKVYGIEHIPYIMERSIEAIRINHEHLLDEGRLEFICKDGRGGLHENGPYDVIHIGGSVVNNPYHLMSQVKANGCLIAPVGLNYQDQMLRRYIKYNDTAFKVDDITLTIQDPLLPRIEQESRWANLLSEYNRSYSKLFDTLKYKQFKEEKEKRKEEERLKRKMRTLTKLDLPPQGIDNFTHMINDLSAMILPNETVAWSPHYWDPKNYA